jgi:flagellin
MAFSINTNLSAFSAYNALTKVNQNTGKAQLRLSTGKRINGAADDTSGYRVGKDLEAKSAVQKAQLNNGGSAKNYLATAEASLDKVNDLLNQISAKYTDAQDPTKNKTAIAKDINSLASEIDSILKNTKFNGHNLLEQSDGTALAGNDVFDVGGDVTMDFASDSYLKVDDLNTILNGGTIADPGVQQIAATITNGNDPYNGGNQTSIIHAEFADGTSQYFNIPIINATTIADLSFQLVGQAQVDNFLECSDIYDNTTGEIWTEVSHQDSDGNYLSNITSLQTTSGFDIIGALGISRASSDSTVGGLLSSDADTVLNTASDLSAVSANVKNALGRIGNLTQVVDNKSDFLTSSITNITSSISRIFDADMAAEQLNATKGEIGSQVGTSMLAQLNSQPQQLLSLFR